MIVIPNEKLLAVARDAGFFESFRVADDVLRQGVQGISDIITIPGIINRDFADVKTTMAGMGHAVMGTAVCSGAKRAIEAAQAAMASPLLETGAIDGARGILINITGSSSLKLSEVNEASSLIQSAAHEDANIIFGAVLDEKMGEEVKITVIATGFRDQMPDRRARMLNVAETPVISVPVVTTNSWMKEPAQAVAAAPAPPRFQSEEEEADEEQMEAGEPVLAAASASRQIEPAAAQGKAASRASSDLKMKHLEDPAQEPARPRFSEMAEEPVYTPLPRDYASDFSAAGRGSAAPMADEQRSQAPAALLSGADDEAERDLDVPAFMRRSQF
jgi:cell division protein FtsZ